MFTLIRPYQTFEVSLIHFHFNEFVKASTCQESFAATIFKMCLKNNKTWQRTKNTTNKSVRKMSKFAIKSWKRSLYVHLCCKRKKRPLELNRIWSRFFILPPLNFFQEGFPLPKEFGCNFRTAGCLRVWGWHYLFLTQPNNPLFYERLSNNDKAGVAHHLLC